MIAVGTPLTECPRTDPYVRLSRIRLPPWVCDGEASTGPRMEDARCREKVGGQLLDALPRDAILLAAPPQRAPPEADRVKPEGPECRKVRWHRVVGKKPGDDLLQPLPLLGDWLVHAPPQLPLDLLKLCPHAVSPSPSLEKETALAGFAADQGKAEEIEGLRLAETTLSASGRRMAAKLDQAGLVRMQRQRELLKPHAHRSEEPTGIGLVLEAGHHVIGITHDAFGHLKPSAT
jgi:hypothetical protein